MPRILTHPPVSTGSENLSAGAPPEIEGTAGWPCGWLGSSGVTFVLNRFSLIGCPELPPANYILVRRDRSGERTVLGVGCLEHDAPSLNLAEVRHRGARLGANEVHVLTSGGTARARRRIHRDLSNPTPASLGITPVPA